MKKNYIIFLLIFISNIVFAQDNISISLSNLDDNTLYKIDESGSYNFNFKIEGKQNADELSKKLRKSKKVSSCTLINNSELSIKFKTGTNINDISDIFIKNNILNLKYNSILTPFSNISFSETIEKPQRVNMNNKNSIEYHNYVISSIEFKNNHMQKDLSRIISSIKNGTFYRNNQKIDAEQNKINNLNK